MQNSTNGSQNEVLKMPVLPAVNESLNFEQNNVADHIASFSTPVEAVEPKQALDVFEASATLPGVAAETTQTTTDIEPLPPLDETVEAAAFAERLFHTWEQLTLARRDGNLAACWGLNVSLELMFRQGFNHMTAYRFFWLLAALLRSETEYPYGCLKVSNQGQHESVSLNDQPANRLTFYAPNTPLHEQTPAAIKQTQAPIQPVPLEGDVSEIARIRQERDAHLAAVEQDKIKAKVQQSHTPQTEGILGVIKRLRRLLS